MLGNADIEKKMAQTGSLPMSGGPSALQIYEWVCETRRAKANPVTGGEVMTLARSIQTSVHERFGILLEHEPVVV